jgi:histidinol-phosphatase (PHP family)
VRVDLHNHTPWCNHATGSPQEYVKRAVELGIDIFAFTEHAPMDFDKHYRIGFEQMELYKDTVLGLRQKYADKIEILFGYEVDYLPGHMDERVLSEKVDFFIGSVHFLKGWGFDNPEFIGGYKDKDINIIYREYFEAITQMAKSGLFDVVGHLDLIKVFDYHPTVDIKTVAKEAMEAIKKADMVLELNAAGLRKPVGEIYPSRPLLEMAAELDIPITFGSDAHSVEQVGFGYEEAVKAARDVGYGTCAVFKGRDRQLVTF